MGRENDLERGTVSDGICLDATCAIHMREPVNAVLCTIRGPSLSFVQVVQDRGEIQLCHGRGRVQILLKRLYCGICRAPSYTAKRPAHGIRAEAAAAWISCGSWAGSMRPTSARRVHATTAGDLSSSSFRGFYRLLPSPSCHLVQGKCSKITDVQMKYI
jgi:hypothetical protein